MLFDSGQDGVKVWKVNAAGGEVEEHWNRVKRPRFSVLALSLAHPATSDEFLLLSCCLISPLERWISNPALSTPRGYS